MCRSVQLTRKVSFSSGHRYWDAPLTESANRKKYGRGASPFNHGHNYVLSVTATGKVELSTGMVVNIKLIDDFLKQSIVSSFEQKSINDEVDWFKSRVPCLENLLCYFAEVLRDLPGNCHLSHLKLEETPNLFGEWNLEQNMISITRTYEFAAAHRLSVDGISEEENRQLFGKCHNPNGHGHNYVLEVTVSGDRDQETGFIVDIDLLDNVVNKEILARYDHMNLDKDVPELAGLNTTSENVALAIFDRLLGLVPAKLTRIRLAETARNIFEVTA